MSPNVKSIKWAIFKNLSRKYFKICQNWTLYSFEPPKYLISIRPHENFSPTKICCTRPKIARSHSITALPNTSHCLTIDTLYKRVAPFGLACLYSRHALCINSVQTVSTIWCSKYLHKWLHLICFSIHKCCLNNQIMFSPTDIFG